MAAAGLMLAPLPALAQSAPDTTTNTPATDAIGPRELQNFSLGGTVTRPADTPPARASAPPQTRAPADQVRTNPEQAREATRGTASPSPRPSAAPSRPASVPTQSAPPPGSANALAFDLPSTTTVTPAGVPQPGFSPEPVSSAATLAPEQKLDMWPWLLLAAALGAGGALLLWRRRSREALAGAPQLDAFTGPEARPAPRPAAAPAPRAAPAAPPAPRPAPPKPVGIVSSRLRPWVDIAFVPIACSVDEERIVIEFEALLTNSGSAPARDILVEASMFNAGATQEQDIGAFFAKPASQGERIQVIAPLQSVTIQSSLVAPRKNIQEFELGGRKVFVPLVAFNALYRLSSGPAQTSAAYMLGVETKTDKLGPLRLDLGPKAFTKLGTRPLPTAIRN